MNLTHSDVVILGGGVAGLTSAVALSERGLRVTLLERESLLGGRARSWTDEITGDRVDIGPHILLTEYRNFLQLLRRLGTEDQIVWQQSLPLSDPPHSVTMHARHLPAPLQFLPSLLRIRQLSLLDKLSNLPVLWQALRLDRATMLKLDSISALDHLQQMGVSKAAIDWFWRTASMTIHNVPLEQCSAGAMLHFIQYMGGRSGYQVGFAAVGLGDLYAPPAQAAITAAGSSVRLNADVVSLARTAPERFQVQLADGSQIDARWCVAALPPQDLHRLLPPEWLRHKAFADLASFEPSPYISSYLWFDRKLTRERFWARVWSPDTLNYDCYDLSNIRPDWSERPSVITSNIIYSKQAADLSDAEIIERTLGELADFIPDISQARLVHARVHRIPMAKPAPQPGTEQKRPEVNSPEPGFFLAGDWVATGLPGSMESAARAGWLAAEAVLAAAGRPESLAAPVPELQGFARVLAGGRKK